MRITWSDVAEADLDDLYDYIARDVPYYAEQFVDRLIEAVGAQGSSENRETGARSRRPGGRARTPLPELPGHLSYRVRRLHILTVIHGSRDLAGQAAKPWEIG